MTNNIVLDVAIGLIFLYTLYSLLATTIKELIATAFSYRGRMLERGLEQMLDGRNYSYYWWDKLKVYFLVGQQMNAEKEAAKKAVQGKAKDKKTEVTDDAKPSMYEKALEYCKSPEITILNNTKLCKKATMFTAEITSHALYTRSSENSFWSKKPAYLPSNVFSNILIDLFTVAKSNVPVMLEDIAKEINKRANDKTDPLNADTAKILNIYIRQANGDLQRFRLLIEGWYDEMMNRVSGWYKRQAFRILLMIGFVLAVVFNVSTIDIVNTLSTDKAVREAMIKSASEYVKAHQKDLDSSASVKDTTKAGKAPDTAKAIVAAKDTGKSFEDIKAGVKKISDLYNGSIQQQNVTLGLGWGDFGFKEDSLKWVKSIVATQAEIDLAKNDNDRNKYCKMLDGQFNDRPERGDFWYKICFIFTFRNVLGFLITALAISLGAPFWFDLLNKFINLRASGAKPEETSTVPKTSH